ncbi:hypothetical protein BXZ70DRAFT_118744 [Cristinia sonorae]|uniref:Uncharacterized protein n=1 Tax=Cristinia sonorae TaxID=1940300 RepID=A0A8K0UPQ5_9AGAR|nr:hypothetical protein BXZ70DRAFT_118744 [Cristinia sonorae]
MSMRTARYIISLVLPSVFNLHTALHNSRNPTKLFLLYFTTCSSNPFYFSLQYSASFCPPLLVRITTAVPPYSFLILLRPEGRDDATSPDAVAVKPKLSMFTTMKKMSHQSSTPLIQLKRGF